MVFSENCIKVFEVRSIDCNNIAAGDFNGFVTEAPLSCPFFIQFKFVFGRKAAVAPAL